jgi:hypothetical protein
MKTKQVNEKLIGQNQNAEMQDGESWSSTQYGSCDRVS